MEGVRTNVSRNPNQENINTKEKISDYLNTFSSSYKRAELDTMRTYCEKMFEHEENRGNLKVFIPKLLSLLEGMKKYPDLRVACFDIMEGADDYLLIFPMFFQYLDRVVEIREIPQQSSSMQDPFSGDPDYALLRGSPKHGIVVLYPQIHPADNELLNINFEAQVLASQLNIYRDFLIKKPEHLYLEGSTQSTVKSWNEYDFTINPIMSSVYRSIAQAIDNGRQLTEREKLIFLRDGGAGFYANMCKLNNTPVTKYPIEQDGYAELASTVLGKGCLSKITEEEHHLIYGSREERVEKVEMETAVSRQGKPAYVVMGFMHKFDNVFLKEDSPAVYLRHFQFTK